MATFLAMTSLRSMPAFRGKPPTMTATSTPSAAAAGSVVVTTPASRGRAASTNSMRTPSRALAAGSMSRRWRMTGWSGPNMAPRATSGQRAYPIWPGERGRDGEREKKGGMVEGWPARGERGGRACAFFTRPFFEGTACGCAPFWGEVTEWASPYSLPGGGGATRPARAGRPPCPRGKQQSRAPIGLQSASFLSRAPALLDPPPHSPAAPVMSTRLGSTMVEELCVRGAGRRLRREEEREERTKQKSRAPPLPARRERVAGGA